MDEWNAFNLPPKGHPDVAEVAWRLFEDARAERERLEMEPRWTAAYKLFRGDHDWRVQAGHRAKPWITINLFFANVQRTVANLTSRNPVAEVVSLDGDKPSATVLTSRLKKWWKDTQQSLLLNDSAQNMEVYGTAIEKAGWNVARKEPIIICVDPFAFFPAPGAESLKDCRYIAHCTAESVTAIESRFRVKGIKAEETYSAMKGDREESRPFPNTGTPSPARYTDGYRVQSPKNTETPESGDRALVVELWIKDESIEKTVEKITSFDPETGEETVTTNTTKRMVYPGGIRVITMTNGGEVLLSDVANPNINPEIPEEITKQSYLYDKFPFWIAPSYRDTTCLWGFSAAEQVGDLNRRLEHIFSKINDYLMRSLCPTLIIPQGCGVYRSQINSNPNLVLMPTNLQASQFIRYLPMPGLPGDFYNGINMMLRFFDRVYQIEDADRGEKPAGIIAASAIVALQERNAALIQHKIRAIDVMVESRGMAAVSLFQNFGIFAEALEVDDEPLEGGFSGINFVGQRFNYVVESGSTTPRTSLQVQEQAVALQRAGAIDNRALLETLNFPGWRKVVERMGENQLDIALNVLIQAGLPQEEAIQLKQFLIQPQGGPGDGKTSPGPGNGQENPPVQSTPAARTPQPGRPAAER